MKEVTYEGILSWVDVMNNQIGQEDDVKEKEYLKRKLSHIEMNLDNYWKYKLDRDLFESHFYCSECGKPEHSCGWDSGRAREMLLNKLCSDCNSHIGLYEDPIIYPKMIIGGKIYLDGGHKEEIGEGVSLGHYGTEFTLQDLRTGDTIKTNNLWGGDDYIPKKYRLTMMKDTHKFVYEEYVL